MDQRESTSQEMPAWIDDNEDRYLVTKKYPDQDAISFIMSIPQNFNPQSQDK